MSYKDTPRYRFARLKYDELGSYAAVGRLMGLNGAQVKNILFPPNGGKRVKRNDALNSDSRFEGLSTRASNFLIKWGINSKEELLKYYRENGKRSIFRITGIGRKEGKRIVRLIKRMEAERKCPMRAWEIFSQWEEFKGVSQDDWHIYADSYGENFSGEYWEVLSELFSRREDMPRFVVTPYEFEQDDDRLFTVWKLVAVMQRHGVPDRQGPLPSVYQGIYIPHKFVESDLKVTLAHPKLNVSQIEVIR